MKRSPGFTMIEMMMVMAMIAVILAFIAPQIKKWIGQSDRSKIEFKLMSIKDAIVNYKLDHGDFPNQREGLKALLENPRPNDDNFRRKGHWPYIEGGEDALEQGGIKFQYNRPPKKNKSCTYFEVVHAPNGEDNDADMQFAGV